MKELSKKLIDTGGTVIQLDLIDKVSGEINKINAVSLNPSKKYYSKRRLNMQIWIEGLDWSRENACKSMTEVKLFSHIVQSLDNSFNPLKIGSTCNLSFALH